MNKIRVKIKELNLSQFQELKILLTTFSQNFMEKDSSISYLQKGVLISFFTLLFYKNSDMIQLVWEIYDGKGYRQECAEILADSYMFNNPFVKPLKLKKQDLIEEFLGQLDRKTFKWVFIYFDAELYKKNIKEIVAVSCAGDFADFRNPVDQDKQIDFNIVPTTSLVRTYMRYKTLEPFWNQIKTVNQYEYIYGGSTAIKAKYMGTGIIFCYIIYDVTLYLKNKYGFKNGLVNAINTIAKKYFSQLYNQMSDVIDLEEMYIVDGDYYPFKGTGLTQGLYVSDLDNVLKKSKQILASRQPKL